MKKALSILVFLLFIPFASFAGDTVNPHTGELQKITDFQTEDGTTVVYAPETIKVPNSSLTDNLDGTASIDFWSSIGASLIPSADDTWDIGSALLAWKDIYVHDLNIIDGSPHGWWIDTDVNKGFGYHYDSTATYPLAFWGGDWDGTDLNVTNDGFPYWYITAHGGDVVFPHNDIYIYETLYGDGTTLNIGDNVDLGANNLTTTGTITSGDITIFDATPILVFKDSNSLGAASVGFIEWRDSGGGRAGFFGNSSSGNDDLLWKNEQGGNIGIQTTGGGNLDIIATLAQFNATPITTTGIGSFGSVAIPTIHTAMTEPTGFVDRVAVLSFVDATRVLTITGNHDIYINGVLTSKTTDTITVTNSTGQHWIYYNAAGVLSQSLAQPGFDLPLMAIVYYNTDGGFDKGLVQEERHGIKMDSDTHHLLHDTVGTRYTSGLTGTFLDATFDTTLGIIDDEDIHWPIGAQTRCDVIYKDGAADFVWLENQTKYYYEDGGSDINYNNGNVLTAAGGNKYVAYWIFATTSITRPIISLMGQSVDDTIAQARANNKYESLELGTLPLEEMKLLYRVILRNDGTPYVETQDLRSVSNLPAGTYVATAHNVLTGLEWSLAGHNDVNLNVNYNADGNVGIGTIIPAQKLTVGNADTSAGTIAILEDTDDGANYTSFTVPALGVNIAYTLPPDDGDNTEQLQTDGNGVLTWAAAGASLWTDLAPNLEPNDDGDGIQINDSTGDDYVVQSHDGADYNFVGTGTTQYTFDLPVLIGGTDQSTITEGLVVNEGGGGDADDDFRVETDTEDNFLWVDAGSNLMRIGDMDTNYVQITSGGDITLVGGASITGDITGNASTVTNGVYTTDNLSVFSPSTSAHLFGVLSDETGSAAGTPLAVFNVNPTLTGATVAGTLDVTGALIEDSDAEDLVIRTNSVANQLVLDSGGSVGIGTAAPGQLLHLSGGDMIVEDNTPWYGGFDSDTSDGWIHHINTDAASAPWQGYTLRRVDGTATNPTVTDILMHCDLSNVVTFPGDVTIGGTLTAPGVASEWTDTGVILHPKEAADAVAIGGTTEANSDIWLGADGKATFNIQGADVNFRIEGDSDPSCFFVDAGNDRVGVGANTPDAKLQVLPSETAIGNAARGFSIKGGSLTTSANSDELRLAEISTTTFETGAHTGLEIMGLHIFPNTWSKGGTGTIDDAYAIYIEGPDTIATDHYGIYIGGVTINSIMGSLGIGDASPAAAFVVGDGDDFQVSSTGVVSFANTGQITLPIGTDPDIAVEGMISWDTDDDTLRGIDADAGNQFVVGQKDKTIIIPIADPDNLADTDTQPIWENQTGFSFIITSINARCNDQAGDDGDFTLKETTDLTDWTALTTIEAITMSTDGTGVDYTTIASGDIDHATIETNHGIIYDASTDDLDWVIITLVGYLDADVN